MNTVQSSADCSSMGVLSSVCIPCLIVFLSFRLLRGTLDSHASAAAASKAAAGIAAGTAAAGTAVGSSGSVSASTSVFAAGAASAAVAATTASAGKSESADVPPGRTLRRLGKPPVASASVSSTATATAAAAGAAAASESDAEANALPSAAIVYVLLHAMHMSLM